MRSRAAGLRLREAARLQLVLVRFEVINGKRDVVNSWQLEKAGLFKQTRAAEPMPEEVGPKPQGGTRTKPPPREPNLPKNAVSKMDPNEPQRETERGLIALVMAVSPSRSRASMACTNRCAGLAAHSPC